MASISYTCDICKTPYKEESNAIQCEEAHGQHEIISIEKSIYHPRNKSKSYPIADQILINIQRGSQGDGQYLYTYEKLHNIPSAIKATGYLAKLRKHGIRIPNDDDMV